MWLHTLSALSVNQSQQQTSMSSSAQQFSPSPFPISFTISPTLLVSGVIARSACWGLVGLVTLPFLRLLPLAGGGYWAWLSILCT